MRITGIVLCGGRSSRMQSDKAFLSYHSKPQAFHVAGLMSAYCDEVLFSINKSQVANFTNSANYIIDRPEFENHGPLTGILSIAEKTSSDAYLVSGCDYPFLGEEELRRLKEAWLNCHKPCSLMNLKSGRIEPLLSIYTSIDILNLKAHLTMGKDSLFHYLSEINPVRVTPANDNSCISVDTLEQYLELKKTF